MFFGYNPQNVIYNFHSPNENECINCDANEDENMFENDVISIDNPIGLGKKEITFPFSFRNRYNALNQSRLIGNHEPSLPPTSLHNKSLSSFHSRNPQIMPTYRTAKPISSYFERPRPSYDIPSFTPPPPRKKEEWEKTLTSIIGETLYVKNLKKLGIELEKVAHVSFPRSLNKGPTLKWYKDNWPLIKPHIEDVAKGLTFN